MDYLQIKSTSSIVATTQPTTQNNLKPRAEIDFLVLGMKIKALGT
jgi:hypothetical protein